MNVLFLGGPVSLQTYDISGNSVDIVNKSNGTSAGYSSLHALASQLSTTRYTYDQRLGCMLADGTDFDFARSLLNAYQQIRLGGPLPAVISGPRASGKTSALVALALRDPRHLVVTHSSAEKQRLIGLYSGALHVVCIAELYRMRGSAYDQLFIDNYDLLAAPDQHEVRAFPGKFIAYTESVGMLQTPQSGYSAPVRISSIGSIPLSHYTSAGVPTIVTRLGTIIRRAGCGHEAQFAREVNRRAATIRLHGRKLVIADLDLEDLTVGAQYGADFGALVESWASAVCPGDEAEWAWRESIGYPSSADYLECEL